MSDGPSFSFGSHEDLLFCLDLANNHQGSVAHGSAIISGVAQVAQACQARVMVKLQFRDLDTFLHPADRFSVAENGEPLSRHTTRFQDTALSKAEFGEMVDCAKDQGLSIYATPFDEASVDQCVEFGFDVIKVASCSAYDWPLLYKIATTDLPVILSLGGVAANETDEIVEFFESKGNPLALMHCISAYPTAPEDHQMDCVSQLITRYPQLTIGYSGHESADDMDIAELAVAKGAKIIERHVGLPTDDITLNAYSLSVEESETWIRASQRAGAICSNEKSRQAVEGEAASLQSLKRGLYARRTIPAGKTVTADDIFLAMPCLDGQFHAGKYYDVVDLFTPTQTIPANMPIGLEALDTPPKALVLSSIAACVVEMLGDAKISLDNDVEIELSHQYGFDRFFEVGAVIIDVVNRDYCKKLIMQFPNQTHPSHRHAKKEETFQVLSGAVNLVLDGKASRLEAGQKQLVERGLFHSFGTEVGVIFEEVSTTHIKGDSEYEDDSIPSDPTTRKTKISLPL